MTTREQRDAVMEFLRNEFHANGVLDADHRELARIIANNMVQAYEIKSRTEEE